MTTERKKAILYLSLTLIAGILLGIVIRGAIGRFHRRGNNRQFTYNHRMFDRGRFGDNRFGHDRFGHGGPGNAMSGHEGRPGLMHTVFRVVHPDSSQAVKIRPIVKEASNRIHAIGRKGGRETMVIIDSLRLELKPILTAEQFKRLEDFTEKARRRWKDH
jgi:hypothetical protein